MTKGKITLKTGAFRVIRRNDSTRYAIFNTDKKYQRAARLMKVIGSTADRMNYITCEDTTETLFEEKDGKIFLDGSIESSFDSRKKFMLSIHGQLVASRKERNIKAAPNTPDYFLLTKEKPATITKKSEPKKIINLDSEKMKSEIDALKTENERLKTENEALRSTPRDPVAPVDVLARLKKSTNLSEFGKSLVAFAEKRGYLTDRQKYFAERELSRVA